MKVHPSLVFVLGCIAIAGCGRDWDTAIESPVEFTSLCNEPIEGMTEIFHAELDSREQVEAHGGAVIGSPEFAGRAGRFAAGDAVTFPANDLFSGQGTLEFCYQPEFDKDDDQVHSLLALGSQKFGGDAGDENYGTLHLLFSTVGDHKLKFELQKSAGNVPVVEAVAFSVALQHWNRIVVTWDFPLWGGAMVGISELKNGADPPGAPGVPLGPEISIGNSPTSSAGASGFIDDVRIYNTAYPQLHPEAGL